MTDKYTRRILFSPNAKDSADDFVHYEVDPSNPPVFNIPLEESAEFYFADLLPDGKEWYSHRDEGGNPRNICFAVTGETNMPWSAETDNIPGNDPTFKLDRYMRGTEFWQDCREYYGVSKTATGHESVYGELVIGDHGICGNPWSAGPDNKPCKYCTENVKLPAEASPFTDTSPQSTGSKYLPPDSPSHVSHEFWMEHPASKLLTYDVKYPVYRNSEGWELRVRCKSWSRHQKREYPNTLDACDEMRWEFYEPDQEPYPHTTSRWMGDIIRENNHPTSVWFKPGTCTDPTHPDCSGGLTKLFKDRFWEPPVTTYRGHENDAAIYRRQKLDFAPGPANGVGLFPNLVDGLTPWEGKNGVGDHWKHGLKCKDGCRQKSGYREWHYASAYGNHPSTQWELYQKGYKHTVMGDWIPTGHHTCTCEDGQERRCSKDVTFNGPVLSSRWRFHRQTLSPRGCDEPYPKYTSKYGHDIIPLDNLLTEQDITTQVTGQYYVNPEDAEPLRIDPQTEISEPYYIDIDGEHKCDYNNEFCSDWHRMVDIVETDIENHGIGEINATGFKLTGKRLGEATIRITIPETDEFLEFSFVVKVNVGKRWIVPDMLDTTDIRLMNLLSPQDWPQFEYRDLHNDKPISSDIVETGSISVMKILRYRTDNNTRRSGGDGSRRIDDDEWLNLDELYLTDTRDGRARWPSIRDYIKKQDFSTLLIWPTLGDITIKNPAYELYWDAPSKSKGKFARNENRSAIDDRKVSRDDLNAEGVSTTALDRAGFQQGAVTYWNSKKIIPSRHLGYSHMYFSDIKTKFVKKDRLDGWLIQRLTDFGRWKPVAHSHEDIKFNHDLWGDGVGMPAYPMGGICEVGTKFWIPHDSNLLYGFDNTQPDGKFYYQVKVISPTSNVLKVSEHVPYGEYIGTMIEAIGEGKASISFQRTVRGKNGIEIPLDNDEFPSKVYATKEITVIGKHKDRLIFMTTADIEGVNTKLRRTGVGFVQEILVKHVDYLKYRLAAMDLTSRRDENNYIEVEFGFPNVTVSYNAKAFYYDVFNPGVKYEPKGGLVSSSEDTDVVEVYGNTLEFKNAGTTRVWMGYDGDDNWKPTKRSFKVTVHPVYLPASAYGDNTDGPIVEFDNFQLDENGNPSYAGPMSWGPLKHTAVTHRGKTDDKVDHVLGYRFSEAMLEAVGKYEIPAESYEQADVFARIYGGKGKYEWIKTSELDKLPWTCPIKIELRNYILLKLSGRFPTATVDQWWSATKNSRRSMFHGGTKGTIYYLSRSEVEQHGNIAWHTCEPAKLIIHVAPPVIDTEDGTGTQEYKNTKSYGTMSHTNPPVITYEGFQEIEGKMDTPENFFKTTKFECFGIVGPPDGGLHYTTGEVEQYRDWAVPGQYKLGLTHPTEHGRKFTADTFKWKYIPLNRHSDYDIEFDFGEVEITKRKIQLNPGGFSATNMVEYNQQLDARKSLYKVGMKPILLKSLRPWSKPELNKISKVLGGTFKEDWGLPGKGRAGDGSEYLSIGLSHLSEFCADLDKEFELRVNLPSDGVNGNYEVYYVSKLIHRGLGTTYEIKGKERTSSDGDKYRVTYKVMTDENGRMLSVSNSIFIAEFSPSMVKINFTENITLHVLPGTYEYGSTPTPKFIIWRGFQGNVKWNKEGKWSGEFYVGDGKFKSTEGGTSYVPPVEWDSFNYPKELFRGVPSFEYIKYVGRDYQFVKMKRNTKLTSPTSVDGSTDESHSAPRYWNLGVLGFKGSYYEQKPKKVYVSLQPKSTLNQYLKYDEWRAGDPAASALKDVDNWHIIYADNFTVHSDLEKEAVDTVATRIIQMGNVCRKQVVFSPLELLTSDNYFQLLADPNNQISIMVGTDLLTSELDVDISIAYGDDFEITPDYFDDWRKRNKFDRPADWKIAPTKIWTNKLKSLTFSTTYKKGDDVGEYEITSNEWGSKCQKWRYVGKLHVKLVQPALEWDSTMSGEYHKIEYTPELIKIFEVSELKGASYEVTSDYVCGEDIYNRLEIRPDWPTVPDEHTDISYCPPAVKVDGLTDNDGNHFGKTYNNEASLWNGVWEQRPGHWAHRVDGKLHMDDDHFHDGVKFQHMHRYVKSLDGLGRKTNRPNMSTDEASIVWHTSKGGWAMISPFIFGPALPFGGVSDCPSDSSIKWTSSYHKDGPTVVDCEGNPDILVPFKKDGDWYVSLTGVGKCILRMTVKDHPEMTKEYKVLVVRGPNVTLNPLTADGTSPVPITLTSGASASVVVDITKFKWECAGGDTVKNWTGEDWCPPAYRVFDMPMPEGTLQSLSANIDVVTIDGVELTPKLPGSTTVSIWFDGGELYEDTNVIVIDIIVEPQPTLPVFSEPDEPQYYDFYYKMRNDCTYDQEHNIYFGLNYKLDLTKTYKVTVVETMTAYDSSDLIRIPADSVIPAGDEPTIRIVEVWSSPDSMDVTVKVLLKNAHHWQMSVQMLQADWGTWSKTFDVDGHVQTFTVEGPLKDPVKGQIEITVYAVDEEGNALDTTSVFTNLFYLWGLNRMVGFPQETEFLDATTQLTEIDLDGPYETCQDCLENSDPPTMYSDMALWWRFNDTEIKEAS